MNHRATPAPRLVGIVAAGLLLAVQAAAALRIPISVGACDFAAFGATTPTGLTYVSTLDLFALTDATDDLVYIFDAACTMLGGFSTAILGSFSPQGIAYNAAANTYAIVDDSSDEIYLTNSLGHPVGNCDLGAMGASNAADIAYNDRTGEYAVVDSLDDEVYVVVAAAESGAPCVLQSQFDTVNFGSTLPAGIAYLPDADQYSVADDGLDRVYLVTPLGQLEDEFDIGTSIDSLAPSAITYDVSRERFGIADGSLDDLLLVDARGTSTFVCPLLIFQPTGVTYNALTDEIAYLDRTNDAVLVIDRATCGPVRQFSTAAFGSTDPRGLTYIERTNQLAIVDQEDAEVYLVGYDSEELQGQCDTAGAGLLTPNQLGLAEAVNGLVVGAEVGDNVGLLDLDCNVIHQRSANAADVNGLAFPGGIGTFMAVDGSTNEVAFTNFEGLKERSIDTSSLGLSNLTGLAAVPGSPSFLVVDATLDAVYRWEIPLLADAPLSLSGRFVREGVEVFLLERGLGRLSGTIIAGGDELPAFGQFEAATRTLVLGVVGPAGAPGVLEGVVSEDLNTIALPPPVGTLTRSF